MKKPGLIETMLQTEDNQIPHLQRHLDRLTQSAGALGITCDIEAIRLAIETLNGNTMPRRLRLELSPDGHWQLGTAPFAPDPPNRVWRLKIAETRLHSTDPLLQHKTTRRHHYRQARQEFTPEQADDVLLCNERGEICEGTITTLFLSHRGQQTLLTPDLSCGLLRGVLRQDMIDNEQACEAVLTPDNLRDAQHLFVGNALRGLLPARLV